MALMTLVWLVGFVAAARGNLVDGEDRPAAQTDCPDHPEPDLQPVTNFQLVRGSSSSPPLHRCAPSSFTNDAVSFLPDGPNVTFSFDAFGGTSAVLDGHPAHKIYTQHTNNALRPLRARSLPYLNLLGD